MESCTFYTPKKEALEESPKLAAMSTWNCCLLTGSLLFAMSWEATGSKEKRG